MQKATELFFKKSKGLKILRQVFDYNKINIIDYKHKKWEDVIQTKICKGKFLNAYRCLQNKYFPMDIFYMKVRLLLGKTLGKK